MSDAAIASPPDAILSLADGPQNSTTPNHHSTPEPNPGKEKKVKIAFRDKVTLVTLAHLLPRECHTCRKCHRVIARNPFPFDKPPLRFSRFSAVRPVTLATIALASSPALGPLLDELCRRANPSPRRLGRLFLHPATQKAPGWLRYPRPSPSPFFLRGGAVFPGPRVAPHLVSRFRLDHWA